MFDNFPTYLQRKPVICLLLVSLTHQHFITSPVKPETPKSFFVAIKGPHRLQWLSALKTTYKKNKNVACFSLPFPEHELPPNTNVLRTLLVPEWKETELTNLWEPRLRECIIGTPQKKTIDYNSSYAPSVDPVTVKSQVCYAAVNNHIMVIVDIKNAFQNTFANNAFKIYATTPYGYMNWIKEEEGFEYDKD